MGPHEEYLSARGQKIQPGMLFTLTIKRRSADHFRDHPRRLQRPKMAHPKPSVKRQRELYFHIRDGCEVKTYRDEHRVGKQILDERFVGGV